MPMHEPACVFEPFVRDELIHAARSGDMVEIDAITDRLAQQGLCRPRTCTARLSEWIAGRRSDAKPMPLEILAEVDAGDIGKLIADQLRGVVAGAR